MVIGDLVNLNLGENDSYEVLRVHGGWLYTRMSSKPASIVGGEAVGTIGTTAFVPEPKPEISHIGLTPTPVNGVTPLPPGGITIVKDPNKPH